MAIANEWLEILFAYTGCFRVNLPYFRRTFLRINGIDKTENNYI